MNDLQIINEQEVLGKNFKIYGTYEDPLFLAKDVAEWIEHSDVSTMVRNIDNDEKLIQTMFVSGQNREYLFLTENGLYEVLMQSRKPIAKEFKKEVKKILKSVRKHGAYIAPKKLDEIINDPHVILELCATLRAEQTKNKELEELTAKQERQVEKLKKENDELNMLSRYLDNEELDLFLSTGALAQTLASNSYLAEIVVVKFKKQIKDNRLLKKENEELKEEIKILKAEKEIIKTKNKALKSEKTPTSYYIKKLEKLKASDGTITIEDFTKTLCECLALHYSK